MFTKLLLIKMVANRRWGLSLKSIIRRLAGEFSSESRSKSAWDKEKKATSEPDMRAEHMSSNKMSNMPRNKSVEGATNRSTGSAWRINVA